MTQISIQNPNTAHDIVKYPHFTLTRQANPISFDPDSPHYMTKQEITELIGQLFFTLMNVSWGKAVGLAAPQVGISKQVFIAQGQVYINPKVTWMRAGPKNWDMEGCYSLPENTWYPKERPTGIELKWQDVDGEFHEKRFNGYNARVILHEYEHLSGILINQ